MSKRVLIAPLNWGLGHATRCIPLVDRYMSQGWEVEIASDGDALLLLQQHYPQVKSHQLPSYQIKYGRGAWMAVTILRQLPRLMRIIQQEHDWLQSYLSENPFDLVISDNRYGLHTDKCECVFLGHQLFIQTPLGQNAVNRINHGYIQKFDQCWIPDHEGSDNLAGKLAHGKHDLNVKYIGPLSRFVRRELPQKYDIAVILSGPEPSRINLENQLLKLLADRESVIVVRGKPSGNEQKREGEIEMVDSLSQKELEDVINSSRLVISRSGYTTIMDLVKLNKEAILIPTPYQTEQMYLAQHLKDRPNFHFIKEDKVKEKLLPLLNEFDY